MPDRTGGRKPTGRQIAAVVLLIGTGAVFVADANGLGIAALVVLGLLLQVLIVYLLVFSGAPRPERRWFAGVLLLVGSLWYAYAIAFGDLDVAPRIVVGVFLATLAVCGLMVVDKPVFSRRPPRARTATAMIAAVGFSLIGGAMLIGLHLLDVAPAPRDAPPQGVGFLPSAPPQLDRGFALGMGVTVTNCEEPVEVQVVAAGTDEYWRDNAQAMRARGSFDLAIPGDVDRMRLGLGRLLSEVTEPIRAKPRYYGLVVEERIAEDAGMTVASGDVLAWPRHRLAVVTSFRADWLTDRGQGSCYLELPSLAGSDTAYSAEHAAGLATTDNPCRSEKLTREQRRGCVSIDSRETGLKAIFRPQEEVVHGNVTVVAPPGGNVLAEESIPPPDSVVAGDPTWTCQGNPVAVEGGALSQAEIGRQVTSNCSGFVAIAEADANDRRDVTLLLTGIFIAVGLGLVIELLMDWVRAEFPLDRERTAKSATET